MRLVKRLLQMFLISLVIALVVPWQASAQDTKSGVVNSRDQILSVTTNQQKQSQTQKANDPPADKGDPAPLPCNSKTNSKCNLAGKTKPGE